MDSQQSSRTIGGARPSWTESKAEQESTQSSGRITQVLRGVSMFVNPRRDRSRPPPVWKIVSRNIVENKFCVAFTMALTIYALLADDIRLLLTDATADPFFDAMVIFCICVFGVEMVLSVLGKADYVWSFFFWLDLVSTASLVLDVNDVADAISAASSSDGDPSNTSNVRGGRAAKIGAKAGRVVRVLRLVRILKLYKAYYEAKAAEKRRKKKAAGDYAGVEDEDDWGEEDLGEKFDGDLQESNVGRKLSEMTTRRVICLILAMLLGLPIMQTDTVDEAARSAHYGADHVFRKFRRLVDAGANANVTLREDYEKALLHFTYYHNWFAKAKPETYCPSRACFDDYYAPLFFVGVAGSDLAVVQEMAAVAAVSSVSVADWEAQQQRPASLYMYGTFPQQARNAVQGNWSARCDYEGWKMLGFSLISEDVADDVLDYLVPCPERLRLQERMRISPRLVTQAQLNSYHLSFVFDLRPYIRTDSLFSLLNTVCILVLLVVASLMFSNDANRIIVHPVERMVKRVNSIRDNPLVAMKMADEEFKAELVAIAKKKRAKREYFRTLLHDLAVCTFCSSGESQPMETVILEKTIIKLGSLLALGFGEAGTKIIGHNMQSGDSAGIDAMIPGTRVECIIGIARVQNFSTATEVLQGRIFTFVNQIAEIVHGVVTEYNGAPNRNSGDYFMIIWRIQDTRGQAASDSVAADLPSVKEGADFDTEAEKMAGMSIVAFSKILGALHRSPLLASYRAHPGLQYRLGAHCRVNLSFGLHAGWAIEGAVGSEFKIDASYLSPNVSIAMSLEQATQAYGVSFMVGQSVVEICPKSMVSKCRLIDKVIIRGSADPIELYVVDLDYSIVMVDTDQPLSVVWNTRNRFKVRQYMEAEKAQLHSEQLDIGRLFSSDRTIREMRRRFTVEFFQLFNMGYQNYSQGEWQVARRMLSCTRAILGTEDGPSSALLRFMEVKHNFEAPKDWKGVREHDPVSAVVEKDPD